MKLNRMNYTVSFVFAFSIISVITATQLLGSGQGITFTQTAFAAEEAIEEDGKKPENAEAGAEFLDQATEAKITASNLEDLARVIKLCDRAKKAGLSEENTEFCDQLKASTQMQRGFFIAKAITEGGAISQPDWETLRFAALSDLEEAIKILPETPEAFFIIAQLNLLPNGDKDRGIAALDIAIEKASEDDLEMKTKAIMFKAILEEDKEKKLALFQSALELAEDSVPILIACGAAFADAGKYDEAINCITKARELDPENVMPIEISYEIYARQKKFDKALEMLDEIQKIKPDEFITLIEKARVLAQMNKLDEAIPLLDEARAKSPREPEILFIRAYIFMAKKEFEKAEKDIEALEQMSMPEEAKTRVAKMKIDLYVTQDKYDEALNQLEKLIEEKDDKVDLTILKANIYASKKDNAKSLEIIEELLKLPKEEFKGREYFNALRTRGDAFLGIGNHYEAIKTYEKALEIDPEDTGVLNNLAWVLATSTIATFRDGEKALQYASKAAELTEYKQAHILSTLGAAYAERNDFENALKWAEKAVELAETDKIDRIEDLKKEVESYKEKKPWREMIKDEDAKENEK
ncbi:MAG: tetratricopeptide repeat protein [Thermoguttaceae bacterium]